MRLARIGDPGIEKPVLIHDDSLFALDELIGDFDSRFWETDGPRCISEAFLAGQLPEAKVAADSRYGAPITRPQSIICIGMNYAAHAAESGNQPPSSPIVFHKAPNTMVGAYDDIAIPPGSTKTDWEVELGVVIGRHATYLDSLDGAMDCVGGYVTVNDLSERTFQLETSGGQWSKGKSFPGFCPTGPWLVTPDEFDPSSASLTSQVNGEPRQRSSTADMIFDVATIVYHLSQHMTLEPGDLICTGTPEGVALSGRFAYLAAGDVVEVEIERLGRQRQRLMSSRGDC